MTNNLTVFPEALKNASDELRKRSTEWIAESEKISSEQHRKEMTECGKIIGEYAELLGKISAEYENSEKMINSFAEEKI